MVSQGSLKESNGILPSLPYKWESDDAHKPVPLDEDFNSEDDWQADEELMYDISRCPIVTRLQRVALGHKRHTLAIEANLITKRGHVANLEIEYGELAHWISDL